MIIQATKLGLTIQGMGSVDIECTDTLIDSFDEMANNTFAKKDYDAAWKAIDEQGILCYLVAYSWAISIS